MSQADLSFDTKPLADPAELPAAHLRPGNVIRRGGRLFEVDHITIPHGMPITLRLRRLVDGQPAGDPGELSLDPGELVRLVRVPA